MLIHQGNTDMVSPLRWHRLENLPLVQIGDVSVCPVLAIMSGYFLQINMTERQSPGIRCVAVLIIV